jgi:hypothetical protein
MLAYCMVSGLSMKELTEDAYILHSFRAFHE